MTMKVKDAPEVGDPRLPQRARPTKERAQADKVADKVSVEHSRETQAAISTVRSNTGASRASRLREVASQLKRGHYEPNPQQIADRILQAAEVDAAFRAMLAR